MFSMTVPKRTRYGCVHKRAQKFSWSKMCLDKSLICVKEKKCQLNQNKKIEGHSFVESIVTS
jgi:hypothetical protein